jgi:hypothetical protein
MFSQVVATLLRLTEVHAVRWLDVTRSHDVPVYGFERVADPPPLEVNTARLLEALAGGRQQFAEEWQTFLTEQSHAAVLALAANAAAATEDGPFSFPDDVWARVIYDVAVAHHARALPLDRIVAALIPLYFGRVASLILETREMTTDQAEVLVERQARAFEQTKHYLVERWAKVPTGAQGTQPVAAR